MRYPWMLLTISTLALALVLLSAGLVTARRAVMDKNEKTTSIWETGSPEVQRATFAMG